MLREPPVGTKLEEGTVLGRVRWRSEMSVTYDAIDGKGAPVLFELSLLDPEEDVEGVARFLNGVRFGSRLGDRATKICDIGALENGQLYVVRAPVDGCLLAELVGQPHEPVRALSLVRGVLAAVHDVHKQGFVLRCLEPAALVVESAPEPDRVLLNDVRFAKPLDASGSVGSRGTVIGRAPYMAPEQQRGEPVDVRADVHACGVIAYELLSGARVDAQGMDLARLDPGLAPIVARATDPQLERRIASLRDLAREFASASSPR